MVAVERFIGVILKINCNVYRLLVWSLQQVKICAARSRHKSCLSPFCPRGKTLSL